MKTLPQVHDWRQSKIDKAALRDGPENNRASSGQTETIF